MEQQIGEVAIRTQISPDYLEQFISVLERATTAEHPCCEQNKQAQNNNTVYL
jgi:hypothetical protein